ncbi:hypothetical protein IFR04_012028 [Cadophora malorum]|uniref:CN hydrolase domain-containing protein n=1 Tax=Cadophora malorum TaxID=108018 RepID=A0A8H7T505_9HELO|nr:hypothetical protein IFR04_012028 [Cadophora malorum]
MKIACLQFAPQVGDLDNNLNRADAVLSHAKIGELDLLVLPELAFSGYNFRSLQHISPYLEPSGSGITALWARTTALKYDCVVTAGYPEKVDIGPNWPDTCPKYYNSAITVNADGETIVNYRKSFLYTTDETWANEGPDGFYNDKIEGLGHVAMGICTDLNPYKFDAPRIAWEFAHHILHREANLVVLSMAWMTRENARSFSRAPMEPDMDTLADWVMRLEPLIRDEGEKEIIVVFANRTGSEDDATYAGTSAVVGIQGGEVKVYGVLGRCERELLIVDTSKRPIMKLVCEPKGPKSPLLPVDTPLSPEQATSPRDSTASESTLNSVSSMITEVSMSSNNTSVDAMDPPPYSPYAPIQEFFPAIDFPTKLVNQSPRPPSTSPELKEELPTPSPTPKPASPQQSLPTSSPTPTPAAQKQRMSTPIPVQAPAPGPKQSMPIPIPVPPPAPSGPKQRIPTPIPVPPSAPARPRDRFPTPAPTLNAYSRPPSPKLRNQGSPVLERILTNYLNDEEAVHSPIFRDHMEDVFDSEVRADFCSPAVDSFAIALKTPALMNNTIQTTFKLPELPFENDTEKLFSPPHYPMQFESIFMSQSLGPRSSHIIPRPRSAVW